jgi:hypothetical protein
VHPVGCQGGDGALTCKELAEPDFKGFGLNPLLAS